MATPSTYRVEIEPRDVDMTLRTSISTFIGIILNIAGEDATSKGFGIDAINQVDCTWVLSRFALEINSLPKLGDNIEITTWIGDYRRLISTRYFSIKSSSGELLGEAMSQWCMMDTKSRRAVDLSLLHKNYGEHIIKERSVAITPPQKIHMESVTASKSYCVEYSDVDFNRHLNSLRYIDIMLNMLDIKLLEQQRALRAELHYHSECYLGEELSVDCHTTEDAATFEVKKGEEILVARCKIEWR